MVRIAIADDHEIVRTGFRMILEHMPEYKVVGEAAEGTQAYALVARERPDVLMLDISMPPGQSGLIACEEIARDFPKTRILIVTMFAEPEYLDFTMRGGASGYLLKNSSKEQMCEAIETVMAGGIYVHPKMMDSLHEYFERNKEGAVSPLSLLATRELEILTLLAKGYTNKEISEMVFLSVKTVESHRAKLYSKLNLKSRADLVNFALAHKLLSI